MRGALNSLEWTIAWRHLRADESPPWVPLVAAIAIFLVLVGLGMHTAWRKQAKDRAAAEAAAKEAAEKAKSEGGAAVDGAEK